MSGLAAAGVPSADGGARLVGQRLGHARQLGRSVTDSLSTVSWPDDSGTGACLPAFCSASDKQRHVRTFQHLPSQRIDGLALLVHDVVVFEQALADVEVVALDLLLRVLDGAVDDGVLDGDVLFHPQALHQAGDALGPEDAHEIVFEREEEARAARIALAAGAAAQLVVDAARFMAFGAQDVQPARGQNFLSFSIALGLVLGESDGELFSASDLGRQAGPRLRDPRRRGP